MANKKIYITVVTTPDDGEEEVVVAFKGDELTSPEQQAILWLREQEGDPLDEVISK